MLVTIDVGSKSEGRIPVSEFHRPGQKPEMNVGDAFDVFIENVDNSNGETILSREKAIKQQSWNKLQDSFDNNGIEVFQEEKYYLLKKNVEIVSDEFELNGNLVKIFFFIKASYSSFDNLFDNVFSIS